ncbi:concanavalin A-like lectin/glucanase domain, Serine/threonine-protein kinase Rad53 [Artemisia annua]|uniref:Concanavalin A-like lectin/glucanase domain, Serine/threonine-protein kinase Rad53 n=1 Tax=Artemisia annua TaxID=35608 RepID=A0A2U1KV88_ARTAN|nr:concanavalin A-like lectin/glucanase domain, Serine/threonine-protein kinase Rad53 [Artemisia annua]
MSIIPVCEELQLSELPQLCIEFTYSDIQIATNYFNELLLIGEGGYGKVYKGNITVGESRDKLVVAIKHLKLSSHQGEREFLAEIGIQSKLRHRNLVSLIGYCKHEEQERFIVLEYISKGSLEDRLHRREYPPLTLVRRLQILIGAACGLDHLHTGTGINHGVIHRDMKTANILLDDNWVAKICDFGLSKTGPTNQTSNYVRGTPGYVDPDYCETLVPTQKTDVYMFGVIMLEVLCVRKAVDVSFDDPNQHVLTKWAQECFRINSLAQIVDTNLVQAAGAISARC